MFNHRSFGAVLLAAAFLAACSNSDNSTGGGTTALDSSTVVNAVSTTSFVTLGTQATQPSVSDPSTSSVWDLAFAPDLTVSVNGGSSGPGGVRAYCLCANRALSLAQVEALTAGQGETAFDAVTAADIPADASFVGDTTALAISTWFDYNTMTHAVTPDSGVWGIRLASTSGGYAKFHVTAIPTPGMSDAGPVTIQWAVQPTATAPLGTDQQATVDLSGGAKVYVNLTTGATSTTEPATWDIAMQGYSLMLNGGANGTGNVAAVQLVPSSFYTSYASITAIPVGADGIPSEAFTSDGNGGAFLADSPYDYDPNSHEVYPTYEVYLVKRGTTVYKVQVTGYYNTGGVFGYITVRYAKLGS